MTFQLVLQLPSAAPKDNPAFWRVCRVPVLTRLVIGAYRNGAKQVVIVGDPLDAARQLLAGDERLEPINIVWGKVPETDLPRVEASADVVLGHPVWKAIDEASGSVSVPGAPLLVKHGQGHESSAPLWQDPPRGAYVVPIKEKADLREAKRTVFRNITKATSGPVSRHFNSLFSIPLTKILVETPMTPNQMTFANTVTGIIGSLFFVTGNFYAIAIGGVIMQLSSALDRCDGELARSKFMESERGAWMDSVGDNITYIAFMLCLTIGYSQFAAETNPPWAPWVDLLGFGTMGLTFVLIGGMFLYVHKNKLGGTMTAIASDFRANVDKKRAGLLFRLLDKVKVLGERDQFSLVLMVLAVLPAILQSPTSYHVLFFIVVGFVLAANAYFLLGWLKSARARARLAPTLSSSQP